ncbi:MAG: hypothetical protein NZ740_01635 [Kiritimatiellae bacterium]|nr:hypothetical protein [Kiritimatiellia bacterium]MDW8457793.1 hypothetical protein [Verrucomicrobiota bacterium]
MGRRFFVADTVFPMTLDVLRGRAVSLVIELLVGEFRTAELDRSAFGAMVETDPMG